MCNHKIFAKKEKRLCIIGINNVYKNEDSDAARGGWGSKLGHTTSERDAVAAAQVKLRDNYKEKGRWGDKDRDAAGSEACGWLRTEGPRAGVEAT